MQDCNDRDIRAGAGNVKKLEVARGTISRKIKSYNMQV